MRQVKTPSARGPIGVRMSAAALKPPRAVLDPCHPGQVSS